MQNIIFSCLKKAALIIFGVFLSIIILEFGLRIGGAIFLSLQERRNAITLRKKTDYRIMCLGESTTALGGKYAYPYQLEEILNRLSSGMHFSVVNKGIAGINTSVIVSHLEDNIVRYSPDMIIVMMGINDFDVYDASVSRNDILMCNSLRVCKLIRLIVLRVAAKVKESDLLKRKKDNAISLECPLVNSIDVENKLRKALELNPNYASYFDMALFYENQGDYAKAEYSFKKAIALNPNNAKAYYELGWCYRNLGDYGLAIEFLRKSIELDPVNAGAYNRLGWCYNVKGEYAQAIESLNKAIAIYPLNYRAYYDLGWSYMNSREFIYAQQAFNKAVDLKPSYDRAYESLALLYKNLGNYNKAEEYCCKSSKSRLMCYDTITYNNYRKLRDILAKRKIILVCLQYPMRSIGPLKKMFPDKRGIVFIDNEKIFKDAVRKESYKKYFIDMFAGDFGHCTPKGNRLLAENIARSILKECLGVHENKIYSN